MCCQTVSSQSPSEYSVVNPNVLLPAFTARGDPRAVAACAGAGRAVEGWAGELSARAEERCVRTPRDPASSFQYHIGKYCQWRCML